MKTKTTKQRVKSRKIVKSCFKKGAKALEKIKQIRKKYENNN